MKINIVLDEHNLRTLVLDHLRSRLGDVEFEPADVKIEVKSKQNFKSEWEQAEFRATLDRFVP